MYKLIRDNIPELIAAEGKTCHYATCNTDGLYADLLRAKLVEETNEFLASNNVEELADILTVLNAILEVGGVSQDDFKKVYDEKLEKVGGFTKRYIGFLPNQQPAEDTTEDKTK